MKLNPHIMKKWKNSAMKKDTNNKCLLKMGIFTQEKLNNNIMMLLIILKLIYSFFRKLKKLIYQFVRNHSKLE